MIRRILLSLPLVLIAVLLTALALPVVGQPLLSQEILELRTESSKTYRVDSDTYMTEFYAGIVHYKDDYSNPSELWKTINLTLKDGQLDTAPYSISIDYDRLSIAIVDKRTGAETALRLTGLGGLSPGKTAPVVTYGKVTFSDIAPSTDIVILLDNDWVKFQWILKTPAAAKSAHFWIDKEEIPVTCMGVDAQGNPFDVVVSKVGASLHESVADATPAKSYPITIDPTVSFNATSSTGHLRIEKMQTYAAAHEAAAANVSYINGVAIFTQSTLYSSLYYIHRGFLYFDTSSIPDSATIVSANLSLYGYGKKQITDPRADLGIVEGVQSTPLVLADYGTHLSKTTLGADTHYDYDAWSLTAYNVKALNATGMGWINMTGVTKFCLRGRGDIENLGAAGDYDGSNPCGSGSTADKIPLLSVTYQVPPSVTNSAATDILSSSANLHGNITACDPNCTVRGFEWDDDVTGAPYDHDWHEDGDFGTGEYSHVVTGMPPLTTIYWRAYATNAYSTGYSDELSFETLLSLPLLPTGFTVTEIGVSEVALNWTTGVDAATTVIRVKEDSYPSDVADGYLVYDGALESTTMDGLNLAHNTYCFRAWSHNAAGYSVDSAYARIGGSMILLLMFGILGLGFTVAFFWKQAGFLGYGAAGMWALLGFTAFQNSASTNPTEITDNYMGLFWLCVAFTIGCSLLPTIMRPKADKEDLYVDEIDRPLVESFESDDRDNEYLDRLMGRTAGRRTRRSVRKERRRSKPLSVITPEGTISKMKKY